MQMQNIMKNISEYFNSISKEKIITFIVNIFFAIIIFLFFYTIAKISLKNIKKINFNKSNEKNNNLNIPKPNRQDNENFYKIHKKFIAELVFYIIILIGIFFSLSRIGINISSLLIILGTIGFAIAFGLQNLIQQIISGISILVFKYFNLGDLIKVKSDIGYVKQFNLINTTIMTNKGEEIIIPNNMITTDLFTNYTKNDVIFGLVEISLSSNNNINYPILFEKIKNKVSLSPFVIDKNELFVYVSDMSGPGTKISIKSKIESAKYFISLDNIRLIARQTLQEEEVKLLDNFYLL
jgi:small-conductance mechanosensitive channel